jgi:hypothetical protein
VFHFETPIKRSLSLIPHSRSLSTFRVRRRAPLRRHDDDEGEVYQPVK